MYRSTNDRGGAIGVTSATYATDPNNSKISTLKPIADSSQSQQQALARVAVGRGIRHSYNYTQKKPASNAVSQPLVKPEQIPSVDTSTQASLSALQSNFQSSLQASQDAGQLSQGKDLNDQTACESQEYFPGMLRRDDSLVDLAMIPLFDESAEVDQVQGSQGLTFIDFPWQEPNSSTNDIA